MASTLLTVQTAAQYHSRDNNLDITTGGGLVVANQTYRKLVGMFPWPEFNNTISLTTTTTSGTEGYSWAFAGSQIYLDVKLIEVGSDASNTEYLLVMPPPSTRAWNEAGKAANGQPVYYMRRDDSGTDKIFLRPIPGYTSATIRVTGIIEPTAMTSASTTGFITTVADDALGYLIAAAWNYHDGMGDIAEVNIRNAQTTLSLIWGKENVTEEILFNIIGGKK